jgi:hypothetical protein
MKMEKDFSMFKDNKKKWVIFDNKMKRVVAGHITEESDAIKAYKEAVSKPIQRPEHDGLTNNQRIIKSRAKRMGISVEDYKIDFPKGFKSL